MKDILYLCQQNPWHLDGGALIRNYWLIKALATRYRVHLVTAGDPGDPIPADFAATCASIDRFPRPASPLFRLRQTLRPSSTFYLSGIVTGAMRRFVRERVRDGSYAFAMLDFQMLDALAGTGLPFVYNAHNTEYVLLERRVELEKGLLQRAFVRIDAMRLKPIERRVVRDAIATLACSADDASELVALAPQARDTTFVVPNGVDVARYAETFAALPRAEKPTILVTGRFDWRPNRVGLDWFVAEVLPLLRQRLGTGSFEVRIAGRMSTDQERDLQALPDVVPARNPADMRDELARARIVAAAILASSGTRLRILEAWAAGRPVVTTPAGAFGLPHHSGDELFAVDGPGAFVDAIAQLLHDDRLWEAMRERARDRAMDFDWNRVGDRFLAEVGTLLP
jgi:glycosyltransferase involved in cell wall biosynthesis